MSNRSTCAVERPPVPVASYAKIPFGPVIRRLKPGTVKVLAAVVRSSWVEQDTRRRVSLASNRQLAELAAVADPETIGRHVRELAEAGVITIEDHEGRRLLTFPESQPGEFVVLDNADQAWTLNPVPFVVLLAVRSFDWTNRGQSWPTDATLARSLGWTVRSVKRAMSALRRAGAVVTSSRYDPVRRSRKRVVTIAGKVVLLCDADHSRKSGPHLSGKVVPTQPEKWSSPTRKSGPLNQSLKPERKLKQEPPTKAKFSGQSESTETDQAEVVVVDVMTSTDTDPEPKPGAGAEAPPMAEVAALLAESQLARDEQERYLAVTRKMTEAPPMAWHRHVLDVEPSSGTRSLAGVVISRLKAWTTTPPVQRAAIVDAIVSKDAEVIAERLRSAKFWFESHLRDLKAGSTTTSAANVRERWQEYNAALTAAGQPPVMLPNEVLHAEQAERERAAKAELAKQENETTLQKCESRIEKTERQLRLYGDPRDPFLTYDPQKIERTYGEVRKVPQDMDPAEYRAALKRIFNRWFPYWEDLDKREQAANPTEVVPTLAPTPPPPPPLLLRVVHA